MPCRVYGVYASDELPAAFFHATFEAVNVSRELLNQLASFGDVAQFFGQVQQSGFVFEDLVGVFQYCVDVLVSMLWFASPSKRITTFSPSPIQYEEKSATSN